MKNICPVCFKRIEQDWDGLPGDYFVCSVCGEFLTVSDSFALEVAGPEQVIGATPLRLKVLLKKRCQILRAKARELTETKQPN